MARFISFHNPSNQPQTYRVKTRSKVGLIERKNKIRCFSPHGKNATEFVQKDILHGSEVEILLKPREVKILDLDIFNWKC